MMRALQAVRQIRTPNSSKETEKTKKLGSVNSSYKNKNMSNSVASVGSSLKKNAYQNNIKSNKKILGIHSSNSNKSLKSAKESNSGSMIYSKREKKYEGKQNQDKRGAIPVKNIRQKICGVNVNQKKLDTTINSKRVNQVIRQKQQRSTGKQVKNLTGKSYYFNKDDKVPIKNRQKTETMNFSSILKTQQSDYQSFNYKKRTLSLDQFEIGRKLGKGRFGDVYMARQIRTGFALAIKIINKKELRESQMQRQLIQQIKIQMYCNHPNILKMYGFFADRNKIYLLLELATNGCLFKEIRKNGYLSQNLASFYFRQVTAGVRYLHSYSVIHRDIKPQNILNCFNVLKLCDFGWAIYSPVYQRKTFCGTLDYVPPQIVTGQFYDEKADVWCLGVLCYELCTGKAPFQSTIDQSQTYDKILKVNIQFPIYLSQQIVEFIGKLLTRDPAKRLNLEQVEGDQWMRLYQNQAGRMISKEIWNAWVELSKGKL